MGDLEARLVELEEAVGRGLLHGLDDAGEALLLVVQQGQAVDELPGRVPVFKVVDVAKLLVRVHAHVVGGQPAKLRIPADHVGEENGVLVAGVDEHAVPLFLKGEVRLVYAPVDVARGQVFGEVHAQGDLVHATGEHIIVPVEIVLLAGFKVQVSGGDKLGLDAVVGQQPIHQLVPFQFPVGDLLAALGEGPRQQPQTERQDQRGGKKTFQGFHSISPNRSL